MDLTILKEKKDNYILNSIEQIKDFEINFKDAPLAERKKQFLWFTQKSYRENIF